MKNLFLSIICCILFLSPALAQSSNKKSELFGEIKALRIQYKLDKYSLNNTEDFGEGSKFKDEKERLSQTKSKIDSLDNEYIKLLSKSELNEYTEWKKKEDMNDKIQDSGWWFSTFHRKGC